MKNQMVLLLMVLSSINSFFVSCRSNEPNQIVWTTLELNKEYSVEIPDKADISEGEPPYEYFIRYKSVNIYADVGGGIDRHSVYSTARDIDSVNIGDEYKYFIQYNDSIFSIILSSESDLIFGRLFIGLILDVQLGDDSEKYIVEKVFKSVRIRE